MLRGSLARSTLPLRSRASVPRLSNTLNASAALSSSAHASVPAVASSEYPGGLPKLADLTVRVNLIDHKEVTTTIVGLVGQSLTDALFNYGGGPMKLQQWKSLGSDSHRVRSATWTEDVFGEGETKSADSQVYLPEGWAEKLPPPGEWEQEVLGTHTERMREQSHLMPMRWFDRLTGKTTPRLLNMPTLRLATKIILTKELEGMIVYVPPQNPVD